MERKECFGSLHEITDKKGFTLTESRLKCRACQDLRDCLRSSKQTAVDKEEENELRKQNMITQIIDLSQIISNELGSCLLEFLDRIYSSPIGTVVFRNLLLFFEAPQDKLSFTMTIPISPSILGLIQGEEGKGDPLTDQDETDKKGAGRDFTLRVVLIQRHFPRNKKANMGLIAYEVARLFSSEDEEIRQILQVLTHSEINLFKTMDVNQRIDWFMERWGFRDEFEAFRKEMGTFKQSE